LKHDGTFFGRERYSGFLDRIFTMQLQHGRKMRHIQAIRSPLDAPLATLHPNQILSFHQWCQLNGISERTGRRILASPDGPIVTQLSSNRFGISVGNNAVWQESREVRRERGRAKGRV
jgi:hypothetical protein